MSETIFEKCPPIWNIQISYKNARFAIFAYVIGTDVPSLKTQNIKTAQCTAINSVVDKANERYISCCITYYFILNFVKHKKYRKMSYKIYRP
jgi:hypothetical protein